MFRRKKSQPLGFCNHWTVQGFGCAHKVLRDTDRCPAGHDPRETWNLEWVGVVPHTAPYPDPEIPMTPSIETEDLVTTQQPEAPYRPFAFTAWLEGGGKDSALMDRLTARDISVRNVVRFVCDKSGTEVTILSLLENGEIPESDARLVCDTYPGTGWHWDAQDKAWEQRLPIPELVQRVAVNYFLVSENSILTSMAPFLSLPDKVVAAHMAHTIQALSEKTLGVEFRIKHNPLARWTPSIRWAESMPDGFLAIASDAAIKSMEADRESDTITEPWVEDSYDESVERVFEAEKLRLLAEPPDDDAGPGRPRVIVLTGMLEGSFGLEGYPSVCYTSRPLVERMASALDRRVRAEG